MSPEDRLALHDLVHRYAAHVDDRDFGSAAALFAEDGVLCTADPPRHLEPVTEHRGHDQVRAALEVLSGVPRTFHAVVGTVFTETETGASGRVACVAHHVTVRDGRPTDWVWHLRYDDSYRRTPAGWCIARRALFVDLLETRPLQAVRADEAAGRS